MVNLYPVLFSAVYMHGLVVVYHCYELMQRGKVFGEEHWRDDEDQLWRPDDEEQIEPTPLT